MAQVKKSSIYIFLAALFFQNTVTFSQVKIDLPENQFCWISGGIGVSSVDSGSLALSANATYINAAHLFSLRTVSCGGIFGDSFWDAALIYGRKKSTPDFFVSIGTGISVVGGRLSRGIFLDDEKVNNVIGLPFEGQAFIKPFNSIGFGLYGFININPENSFLGTTLSLSIGKLR